MIKFKEVAKIVFQRFQCFRRECIDLEKVVICPPPHIEIRVAGPGFHIPLDCAKFILSFEISDKGPILHRS